MPTRTQVDRFMPVVLVCAALTACPEAESGVGRGPTGEDSGLLPSGTGVATGTLDEGADDTDGVEVPPPVPKSYFIAESMDFSGNGCEDSDLNEVTESLHDELLDDGWAGTRLAEGQTRPADFIDSVKQAFGQDHTKSDAVSLAVYAGHGWLDILKWGVRDETPGVSTALRRCMTVISEDMRLGAESGGWAKTVALLTSCTGRLACYESTLATSDATQIFAFNNSPAIWGNAARRFYRNSKDMSNRDAWLTAMDNRPGFGRNSPVVYTRGTSEDEARQIHGSARLSQIDQTPQHQGTTWYAYTWVDHGSSETCDPLPQTCVGVDD